MEYVFKVARGSRELYLKFLVTHTLEQLNKIPEGFNNNLFWNIAHIVVSQQMIVYKLAGLPVLVTDEHIAKYSRGTKPEAPATIEEVNEIQALLLATHEKTEQDYNNGIFTNFSEYTTEFGFVLTTVEDAISFNNYHEAVHLGIMMQLKKFV